MLQESIILLAERNMLTVEFALRPLSMPIPDANRKY